MKEDTQMPNGIDADEVREWLNNSSIYNYEDTSHENPGFGFSVSVDGVHMLQVLESTEGDYMFLRGGMEFESDILTNILDREHDERQLGTLFASVLTNAGGRYRYLDDEGNGTIDLREVRTVEFDKPIFPDGASQHELINSLYEMNRSLKFINIMVECYKKNLEEQT